MIKINNSFNSKFKVETYVAVFLFSFILKTKLMLKFWLLVYILKTENKCFFDNLSLFIKN